MNTEEAVEMFDKKCGTLEEYGGDKKARLQDLGVFFLGWLACEEANSKAVTLYPPDKEQPK